MEQAGMHQTIEGISSIIRGVKAHVSGGLSRPAKAGIMVLDTHTLPALKPRAMLKTLTCQHRG